MFYCLLLADVSHHIFCLYLIISIQLSKRRESFCDYVIYQYFELSPLLSTNWSVFCWTGNYYSLKQPFPLKSFDDIIVLWKGIKSTEGYIKLHSWSYFEQGYVAIRRITKFLNMEELTEYYVDRHYVMESKDDSFMLFHKICTAIFFLIDDVHCIKESSIYYWEIITWF